MSQWPLFSEAAKFYGKPGPGSFLEKHDLQVVKPPWRLTYDGEVSSGFRVHKLVAPSLAAIFAELWEAALHSQSTCDMWGISISNGGYNPRPIRGGKAWSPHAYGAAIDMDAGRNSLGSPTGHFRKLPIVLDTFRKHGWFWGGDYQGRKDPMHFEAFTRR